VSRLKLFIPLFLFFVLAGFLFRGLQLDPTEMPSALIDRPLPEFQLARLGQSTLVQRADVLGEVALFNVWATWCISCRMEHPYLQKLADEGVAIFGVNYKDETGPAMAWLAELGNPYRLNIEDVEGTLGLDLGVFGAPETYLVDAKGVIRYRHVGVVNDRIWKGVLQPLYDELNREASAQ
jgi:cytochrome c biogenesis protein CcmG/thiol:disulfide interchange protein DsbE